MHSLFSKGKFIQAIYPQACTSDGVTGTAFTFNGYNRIAIALGGGLVATGDSDDTMAFQLSKNIVTAVASDAAATDWVDITLGTQTLGASADTDTILGAEFLDVDLNGLGLSTGLLRISATASEGCSASVSSWAVLHNRNGLNSDADMTITKIVTST